MPAHIPIAAARGRGIVRWLAPALLAATIASMSACSPQPAASPQPPSVQSANHRRPVPAAAMNGEQRTTERNATIATPADVHITSEPTPGGNPHDEAIRSAAASEIGAAAAASMPAVPPTPPPEPADPGAAEVIASITRRLSDRAAGPDGTTTISACELRNLSHSTAEEFASFRARLCAALTEAGHADRIAFTDDADSPVQYRLLGSAYVVTADGFDQWEMYLSLTPVARDFQVWDARGAVRMLRLPRPGQQQITFNPR